MDLLHHDITEQIIGAAFEVHRLLGYGFLERVYHRAMQVELELRGLRAKIDDEVRVIYKTIEVGLYKPDILVNDCVVVSVKVAKAYRSEDEAQLLNELKATGIKVGLLINFGRARVEFKRFVF